MGEPEAARAVLVNGKGLYQEHADFFQTRRGIFGPRSSQLQIGRAARVLVQEHLAARADELAEAVRRALVPSSEWPDAGNRLLYRHLAPVLVAPDSPERLRRTVDEVVERAVLAGARQRYSLWSRVLFRFRVARELARAVEHRRKRGAEQPADLLDVVVGAAGPDGPEAELAEVFLSYVFAVAGSIGFVLGWSLYLLGTNPRTEAEPGWVVREALRLWPVAWMLGCRPATSHEVAGVAVTPEDEVVVCPYLVHRHPRYWDEPASFRPERWASVQHHPAFIPFGWGPHTCPASSLSMTLVEDILRIILDGYRLTLTAHDTRPFIGPALAPPRFTLGLEPHRL
ncbi:MAG TPA: cytochrome P450 [Myxococcaceae bacterium]|nr:cytochrome P450 [Myxococcaceae bacterium]